MKFSYLIDESGEISLTNEAYTHTLQEMKLIISYDTKWKYKAHLNNSNHRRKLNNDMRNSKINTSFLLAIRPSPISDAISRTFDFNKFPTGNMQYCKCLQEI